MLLVAGGQLDPNIGALLRRCLERKLDFRDLLIGPGLTPTVRIELDGRFLLNGEDLRPSACFLRHDVFLAQHTNAQEDCRAALNWYHAVRDWALARTDVRVLNRHARSTDLGKYGALLKARSAGLAIPDTRVSNILEPDCNSSEIRKPVAGGELTTLAGDAARWPHPYFVQPRLSRPEMRVYRIGCALKGFLLRSDELDYRASHRVEITPCDVPGDLAKGLLALCDDLCLDFAAADFLQDTRGSWIFLEINSQPMFAAFDAAIGGELSDLLIDWLMEAEAAALAETRVAQRLVESGRSRSLLWNGGTDGHTI